MRYLNYASGVHSLSHYVIETIQIMCRSSVSVRYGAKSEHARIRRTMKA